MNKRSKLTLEDIGSFLEKLAEKSESVYWLSSTDFKKIQYISPAYEKIWGRARDILYKEPERWITYLHPDDVTTYNPIHAMAERIAKEGHLARYHENYRIVRPDGEVRWIIDQGFPIYDERGECCGVTGIAVDITKDKLAEEALRKEKEKVESANRAKTEFLNNMRHDIRTPLMGITGFADIIKNEVSDPKIKEYADNLVASSRSLLDLLNEVLEVIKVSSGEVPLLKKKFELQKKLNEVILLNQAKASHKNIALLFEYDATIPHYLIGDSVRVHRIVLELIANALNFTHKGQVKLSAQLAKDNETDVVIKIIVEDTGIGIAPEKQQEVYVRFNRLTPSYEGIYKGFGLGLSIVKQFIDDLQGEIYIESQLGIGSKFTVIVSLKKSLLNEALGSEDLLPSRHPNKFIPVIESKPFEPVSKVNAKTSYRSRVLLVEDSQIAAHVVSDMLSMLDCIVDVADQGRLAIKLAQENQYDFIFMDIGLPDIDGYETTKQIRLDELQEKRVPIIALTAHANEENKQECINAGMNAVLTKPLMFEQAEGILNSFIPYRKNRLEAKVSSTAKKANEAASKVIDFNLLKKQYGDEKVITSMLAMLVDGLPKELKLLNVAYRESDWSSIQSLAHKLKGSASYCGAMRLQEVCGKLESAVKAGENKLITKLYKQLLDEMKLVEKTIKINHSYNMKTTCQPI